MQVSRQDGQIGSLPPESEHSSKVSDRFKNWTTYFWENVGRLQKFRDTIKDSIRQIMETDTNEAAIPWIPDEVLIQILACLDFDDLKACRLVCRRWYQISQDRTITQNEKFIFRYPIFSLEQMNYILIYQINRTRISVEFVDVNLTFLHFERFGEKIEKLRITNCFINDVTILKDIISLPNMKHLDFRRGTIFPGDNDLVEELSRLIESGYANNSLEKFDHSQEVGLNLASSYVVSRFLWVFPRVNSTEVPQLDESFLKDLRRLRKDSESNNLQHCCNVCLNFVSLNRSTLSLISLPKLKTLHLKATISFEKLSSVDLFHEFIQGLTELETLVVQFKSLHESGNRDKGDIMGDIFIHILRSCKPLRKLTIELLNFEVELRFTGRSIEKLYGLILRNIEELEIPPSCISGENVSFENDSHRLKRLNLVVRPTRMKGNDLCSELLYTRKVAQLHLQIYKHNPDFNLKYILATQEDLQTLEIESLSKIALWGYIIQHNNLKHLTVIQKVPTIKALDYLFLCEFPNLKTFSLTFRMKDGARKCEDEKKTFKTRLIPWLQEHSTLEKIRFPVQLRMKYEELEQISRHLPRLKSIDCCFEGSYATACDGGEDLFANHPRLRFINTVDYRGTTQIYYSRLKRRIYASFIPHSKETQLFTQPYEFRHDF